MLWDVVLAENHLVGQLWNLIFAFHCLLKSRLGEGTGNNFRVCVLPSKGAWFSTGILRLLLHSRHNVVQPFWIVQSHKFRYLFVQKTQLSCPGLVTVEKVIPSELCGRQQCGDQFFRSHSSFTPRGILCRFCGLQANQYLLLCFPPWFKYHRLIQGRCPVNEVYYVYRAALLYLFVLHYLGA